MLKIRRSRDRLIFNVGIPILVRRHLYIETTAGIRSSEQSMRALEKVQGWFTHRGHNQRGSCRGEINAKYKEGRPLLPTGEKMAWYKTKTIMLSGNDSRYKSFWTGYKEGNSGVGILLTECWVANVFYVVCISDRNIFLKLSIGNDIYSIIFAYTPLSGHNDTKKRGNFHDKLRTTSKIHMLFGDWNGYVATRVLDMG